MGVFSLPGLEDKLYWREITPGVFHCFKRTVRANRRGPLVYTSLCDRVTITRVDGQDINRPICVRRCPQCDVLEIARREADESMPERITRTGSRNLGKVTIR